MDEDMANTYADGIKRDIKTYFGKGDLISLKWLHTNLKQLSKWVLDELEKYYIREQSQQKETSSFSEDIKQDCTTCGYTQGSNTKGATCGPCYDGEKYKHWKPKNISTEAEK